MATAGVLVEAKSRRGTAVRGQAVAMAAFAFAASYFREFLFPNVPLALWGDRVGFFNDGSRIVAGQVTYRDYFKFVPPGTDLVYALLIKCFGLRIWIPNLLIACIAGAVALLMTVIARRVLRDGAWMPAAMFAGIVLVYANDPTHHWFSTIAMLAAIVCLLDETTMWRVLGAGACCGAAACFTQTKGFLGLLAIGVYLLSGDSEPSRKERWKAVVVLCAGAAAVFIAVNAYFIGAAGIKQWFYCVVEFPLRYYPAPKVNNWRVLTFDFREHRELLRWFVFPFMYVALPGTYIAMLWALRRRGGVRGREWQNLLLVTLVGVAMLLAAISAPSMKRLSMVSPPAMILLIWLLSRSGKWLRRARALILAASLFLAVAIPLRLQVHRYPVLDLPSGRAAIMDKNLADEYAWFREHTRPGEYCFGLAPLYYTFHLPNPAPIEGYDRTDYTRPEQVTALVQSLETKHVPMIVLRWSKQFVESTGLPSDHLGPFREYLVNNYRIVKQFPTEDDVWLRDDLADPDAAAMSVR